MKRLLPLLLLVGCGSAQIVEHESVRWSNIPILVYCHETVNEMASGACDEAIRLWNLALGFELFQRSTRVGVVAVLPDYDTLRIQGRAGVTTYYVSKEREIIYAMIQWDAQSPPDVVLRALTHEFGHAAGLDHLDNPECVMFKSVSEEPAPWYICEESARFLQEVYGP